jgi:hypothetical protein
MGIDMTISYHPQPNKKQIPDKNPDRSREEHRKVKEKGKVHRYRKKKGGERKGKMGKKMEGREGRKEGNEQTCGYYYKKYGTCVQI